MDEKIYDVLVIGAGPAGGSAALHCARNGLKTIVIEEHDKVGEPVHCGECLSLFATINTNIKIPEEVISSHVNGIRIIWPNGKGTILNEKGFVLEKHLFEQWLVGEATKAGAELRLSTRADNIKKENGIWEVETGKGVFKAKILIDASGVASVVSRKIGLNNRFEAVIGIQYELKGIERDNYIDFYIWPKLAPHGYLWMIPKKDTRANVGLVTTDRNKAKAYNEMFIEKKGWKDKERIKVFGGLIPASGPVKNTYAEGLILVGDAAGFTSPLFEGGSHLGLKSGKFAAEVAKEAIEKNDFSKEMFSKYEKLWKAEFPEYSKIIKGKNALYGLTDEELNIIGNCLPDNFDNFNYFEKIKFGLKVFSKKPTIFLKGFVAAMKSFEYSKAEYYGW
jgi:digeranylgeranylglycerophospholipid reductase